MSVAVVIPALDEAGTIAEVVAVVAQHGQPIVVDDGSHDGTGLLAASAGAIVVRHERNGGYDAALRSGFRRALTGGCEVVVTIDADAQHDPAIVAQLAAPILAGRCDLVLGVRPAHARRSERLFSGWVRRRHGVPDILCGAKAYRAELCRTYDHELERRSIGTALALASLRGGARVELAPVEIRPRTAGVARFGLGLRSEGRILRAFAVAVALDLRARAGAAFDHRHDPVGGPAVQQPEERPHER